MIDSALAQELVERLMRNLEHNINIMNEKGIIIASGDPKRIGDFHEAAHEIINRGLEYKLVDPEKDDYIGTKPGINMPIVYEGETIGAIGITGDPDEVSRFASLVRMNAETMIEHEYYKQHLRERQTKKDFFCNTLLFEPSNINKIEYLAKNLKYDILTPRVPIKICILSFKNNESVLAEIKNKNLLAEQDIAATLEDNSIAIFKSIPGSKIGSYREIAQQYINNVRAVLTCPEEYMFLVSTVQRRLRDYRQAFEYVTWLEDNIKPETGRDYFFMDYVDQFYQEIIPFQFYDSVYSPYLGAIEKFGSDSFVETVKALYNNSMNVNETAKELFMHRNTILLRIKKMKEIIGIDVIHSIKNRNMAFHLAYYVTKIKNTTILFNKQDLLKCKYSQDRET